MASIEQRRKAFGTFVRVALSAARARGLTITAIEERTGVASSTFYRWRDGDWSKDPRPGQVRAFCEGLDIPYESAYRTLGWTAEDGEPVTPDEDLPPEVHAIMRELRDPNVPESRKTAIRAMLQLIAREHGRRAG